MICLTRRGLLQAAATTAWLPVAQQAWAQTWPERPLRFVVPAAPGAGILDIIARMIGLHLAVRLGQQVVIENKPGAGNNIATE